MPQCLEERTTIPRESDGPRESIEQRQQRRRIEFLKKWEIKIQPLDRGCIVSVGCKSFAFDNIDAAAEVVKQYISDPDAVIKHYGFENHI